MAPEPLHKQVDLRDIKDFQLLLDGLQTLKHGPWKPHDGFSAEEYAAGKPLVATKVSHALVAHKKVQYHGKFVALRFRGPTKCVLLQEGRIRDLLPFSGEGTIDGQPLHTGCLTRLTGDAKLEVPADSELYCLWLGEADIAADVPTLERGK
ncbi:hypothetical protein F5Y06DRAFT_213477 [Hypoxylon sp. FL0890]|nr:hypothetical protein F5Y06DRAFT_213477 [Hypoxylon sp. FL0890]